MLYESRYGILKLTQGARQSSLLQALERVRQSIDILIAGIAIAQSATLVTRHTREFSRIKCLLLENWYDA